MANKKIMSSVVELPIEGFATIKEAGAFLHLSRASIYQLMDAGEIRYAKFGSARRVPWSAVREYAAKCMVGS